MSARTIVTTHRESRLLVEVERYVAHIGLDLTQGQSHRMVIFILDGRVWRHPHVRLSGDFDNIGEEVPSLESEVLNNEIKPFVGVFDAWNWNIADLLNERRDDHLADIPP
jgi:hypothetical protein